MSSSDSDDDLRWRDRVVGAAQPPLPEPWFIRAARGDAPAPQRGDTSAPQRGDGGADRGRVVDDAEPLPMILPPRDFDDAGSTTVTQDVPRDLPPGARAPRRAPWRTLAVVVGVLIAAIAAWLSLTPKVGGAPPVATMPEDLVVAAPPPVAPLDCASPATITRLRDILVGMARQADGNRDGGLQRRASGLSVGVAAAPDTATGDGRTLACRGSLSLLPLGDGVPVAATMAYRIRPAANGGVDIAGIQGVGPIVAALARSDVAAPPPSLDEPAADDEAVALPPSEMPAPRRPEPEPVPRAAARTTLPEPVFPPRTDPVVVPRAAPPRDLADAPETRGSGPSFDCRRVTSQVLVAICANPRLAALDVEMSELFFAVRDGADPDTRAQLDASRGEFIAKRQSCRDDRCIARVTRERIRELEDTP